MTKYVKLNLHIYETMERGYAYNRNQRHIFCNIKILKLIYNGLACCDKNYPTIMLQLHACMYICFCLFLCFFLFRFFFFKVFENSFDFFIFQVLQLVL